MIENIGTGKPVEVRAPSPKGPKVTQEDIDRWNAAAKKSDNLAIIVERIEKETKDMDKIRTRLSEIERKYSRRKKFDQQYGLLQN